MKPLILGILILAASIAGDVSTLFAQEANTKMDGVLGAFRSSEVQKREDAFYEIQDDAEALRRPEVKKALIELLNRENHYSKTSSYGEGYLEYLFDLSDTVAKFIDWQNDQQVCALVESPAQGGGAGYVSESTMQIAAKAGKIIIPCLLRMAHGSSAEQETAFALLLKINSTRTDLSASESKDIHDVLISVLRNPEPAVRKAYIEAVGSLGKPDLIPILEDIAHSDPYSSKGDFPIRATAMKAIDSIRGREQIQ